ncbi:cystathionine beta-lyase [Hwanghaeella grinnelliae]|uniref:Cystathionine beta-lyase n=1 Tax=Hwanghaeella grinnelliae TaxID=2500179 RepID=A0A437QHL9_9PROT|nr:cystathionine beta-lyase [Hwanghaeella grinnelliae]RVU34042.1 cystathionine beta-lyase [Hwanghaeella grinnelliae]
MKDDTKLTHAGRHPHENHGAVNTPVYHASTILFPTLADFDSRDRKYVYGRKGTPTTSTLEEAVSALEQAHGTVLAPSGLAAVTTTLMSFVQAGGHVLLTDSTYFPTRKFASGLLARLGIEAEYYDPLIGNGIEALIRPNTNLIWMESPGSLTFEMQDVPAIVAAAKKHGVPTAIDNTWSGGYFFKPLTLGVDVSVQAATKYIVGHSDAMLGTIACNQAAYPKVLDTFLQQGNCAGPDDVYLGTRGLRTMAVRMNRQHENGIKMAEWLRDRPEVIRVMHPALPEDPGHEIWKRDFTGASGLFGFVVDCTDRAALGAMLDGLALFGMGASWGGYESLILPSDPSKMRSATKWEAGGTTLRMHVGLEDTADLIDDLTAGFDRLNSARR